MKARAAILMLLVLPASVGIVEDSDQGFSDVERVVEEAMATNGVLGASVAIIDDFEIVYARGFGLAEPGRPVEPETVFQAASLSKAMSAVVAAAAAEEGLVDLDTDVSKMLISWRLPPMPYDGPITLRMLMAHRAGVNVHGFPGYRLDEPLPELTRILDGVRDKNEPIRVIAEPGAGWQYSGGGFVIAQQAIEDHTGLAWEDLADDLVFGPLGLERSTYRILDASQRGAVAVGYRPDATEVAGGGWHQYPEGAPASLWTTPTEYATMLIDVMKSHQDGTGTLLDQASAGSLLDPDYPVGFGVTRERGGIAIQHDGANEGYRTAFIALPNVGQGVVVMTNNDAGTAVGDATIDIVAEIFAWPWTGWSTPLWAVLGALGVAMAAVSFSARRKRRQRRSVPTG